LAPMGVRNSKVIPARLVSRSVIPRRESYLHFFDFVVFAHSVDSSPCRRITPPSRVIALDNEYLHHFPNALDLRVAVPAGAVTSGTIIPIYLHSRLEPECAVNILLYPLSRH
jgi:hypothetical protein